MLGSGPCGGGPPPPTAAILINHHRRRSSEDDDAGDDDDNVGPISLARATTHHGRCRVWLRCVLHHNGVAATLETQHFDGYFLVVQTPDPDLPRHL